MCQTPVTEDEIFIKLVNMEGKTDPIEISLDCGVEREYEAVLLTGEKTAENTFEEPEKVSDKTVKMEGAPISSFVGVYSGWRAVCVRRQGVCIRIP